MDISILFHRKISSRPTCKSFLIFDPNLVEKFLKGFLKKFPYQQKTPNYTTQLAIFQTKKDKIREERLRCERL